MANQYTDKSGVGYAKVEAKQDMALEVLRKNPAMSARAISLELGWPENTVKQWYHRDTHGFKKKWHDTLHGAFDRLEGLAIQCMADLIVDGSFQAAKYVLDNKGYAAPKEIKADVNTVAQVVFVDDLEEIISDDIAEEDE
jgi:hypothetical protein